MKARAAYRVRRFRWRLVQTPGEAFPRCERKSAVCFFYLQGGRITSSQLRAAAQGLPPTQAVQDALWQWLAAGESQETRTVVMGI